MEVNRVGRRPRIRFAKRDSISPSSRWNWRTCSGSAARSSASVVSRARLRASPRTNVSAISARVASSRSVHVPISGPNGLPSLGRPGFAAQRPVLSIAERVVGLDQGVELARALVDDGGLRVAQVALDRELVGIAIRPVDLDRIERALDRVLRRVPLGKRRLAGVALALVLQPASAPDEQPPHLGPRDHLGDELLDKLMLADLLTEGVPLVGVSHARIDARLGEPDG